MSDTPHSRALHLRTFARHALRPLGLTACLASALVALTACSDQDPTGQNAGPGRSFSVMVRQTLALRLQSIGPGEYTAPPQLSSGAVEFVDVELVGPAVPAGVTQLFRFRAVRSGTSVITFQHTANPAVIVDTVVVH